MEKIGYRPRLSSLDQEVLKNYRTNKLQTWLVIFDVHIPFHNKLLTEKVLKLCNYLGHNLYGFVDGGDLLELFTLGTYNAGSVQKLKGITLGYEYEQGNKFLDNLEDACPNNMKKHKLWGNHEDRYKRCMASGDMAKFGNALVNPTEALHLRERGFEVYENWAEDAVILGNNLHIMHGLSLAKYCAAGNLRDFRKGSIMTGHTHREQTYKEGEFASYSVGGLFDKENPLFHYMPKLKRESWNNGFALIHIDDHGNSHVEVVNITPTGNFFAYGKLF